MSREFLLIKPVCAACGANLTMTYDLPKGSDDYSEGEPTGGIMVKHIVAVEPCSRCMEPLNKIRRALQMITKEGGAV